MLNIKTKEEFESLIKEGVTLVDFYADWCGPCRMLAPVLEETSKEYSNKVKFAKVNVDILTDLAEKYQVATIPTVIIFKNNQPMEITIGYKPKDFIKNIINKYLEK